MIEFSSTVNFMKFLNTNLLNITMIRILDFSVDKVTVWGVHYMINNYLLPH